MSRWTVYHKPTFSCFRFCCLVFAWGFFSPSLSLAGVSCLRGSDSCVCPSKRLKLALVLRSRRRNFVLGIWGSDFQTWGVWSKEIETLSFAHFAVFADCWPFPSLRCLLPYPDFGKDFGKRLLTQCTLGLQHWHQGSRLQKGFQHQTMLICYTGHTFALRRTQAIRLSEWLSSGHPICDTCPADLEWHLVHHLPSPTCFESRACMHAVTVAMAMTCVGGCFCFVFGLILLLAFWFCFLFCLGVIVSGAILKKLLHPAKTAPVDHSLHRPLNCQAVFGPCRGGSFEN